MSHGLTHPRCEAFTIPIILTALVGSEHRSVLSLEDTAMSSVLGLGAQVTPQYLRALPNDTVMGNIVSSTITGRLDDKQPFLWSLDQSSSSIISVGQHLNKSSLFDAIPTTQFIATFPVGTDTGLLRYLALRLNLSVSCDLVPQTDFPSQCPGASPLNQTFTNINFSTSSPFGDVDHPRYRARICAPGDIFSSPWMDTLNRQDISEEVWIDYQWTSSSADIGVSADKDRNFTQHCYGNSTLGFFELPNYWNGHVIGPLLDRILRNGPNLTYRNGDPSQSTAGSISDIQYGVPGPFLTAILAIFGPNSFFTATAASSNYTSTYTTLQLCAQLRYPFTSLANSPISQKFDIDWKPGNANLDCLTSHNPYGLTYPLLTALMNWMPNFGNKDTAIAALTLTTYAAGNAILSMGTARDPNANDVSSSPGTSIQRPTISLAGIIVVSLLLVIQILGLLILALYSSRSVGWTASLDSFAMLRIGLGLGRPICPL